MQTNNDKAALYLGGILIAIALIASKWTIGILFSTDRLIDSYAVVLVIALLALLALGAGLYIAVRRPSLPYKEIYLVAFSVAFTLLLLELGSRIWLDHLATDSQARKYKLASEMEPEDLQWAPHHYLNYYPAPNYRKGQTAHNSLGYRDREFPLEKPDGTFRIVALGGVHYVYRQSERQPNNVHASAGEHSWRWPWI